MPVSDSNSGFRGDPAESQGGHRPGPAPQVNQHAPPPAAFSLALQRMVPLNTDPEGHHLGTNYLPMAAFSPEERFKYFLLFNLRSWWCFYVDCVTGSTFMLLDGRIPPATSLTRQEAWVVIDETLNQHRQIRSDPSWLPTGAINLSMDDFTHFRADLTDPTFFELFYRIIADSPMRFLTHARRAIQRIISPPVPHSTRGYPRNNIVRDPTEITDADAIWLESLLEWDPRWGYGHWHSFIVRTSGYRAIWFDDPGTYDILVHTLRRRDSAGWLAMSQQDPNIVNMPNIPVTVETISSVLAALAMEIGALIGWWPSVGATVDELYVAIYQAERERIYAYLFSILDGTIVVPHAHNLEAMRRGLSQWLDIEHLYTNLQAY